MDYRPFITELNKPQIHLPRAALVMARTIAYPGLDVLGYLNKLEILADEAYEVVDDLTGPAAPICDRVEALSEFLFQRHQFSGNRRDYYDPRNSFLNDVLDRKKGIPISLSLLWISLARRIGINAYGVGLPGHFLVGVFDGHGSPAEIFIDPFHGGLRRSVSECDQLVRAATGYEGAFQPKWLAPITPVDLLTRMLTNLSQAYIRQEDWTGAIPVLQHLLLTQPDSSGHLRDLGLVHFYAGSMRLSAQYLEEYLRRAPAAPDFEPVRQSLDIVAGRLALWN